MSVDLSRFNFTWNIFGFLISFLSKTNMKSMVNDNYFTLIYSSLDPSSIIIIHHYFTYWFIIINHHCSSLFIIVHHYSSLFIIISLLDDFFITLFHFIIHHHYMISLIIMNSPPFDPNLNSRRKNRSLVGWRSWVTGADPPRSRRSGRGGGAGEGTDPGGNPSSWMVEIWMAYG